MNFIIIKMSFPLSLLTHRCGFKQDSTVDTGPNQKLGVPVLSDQPAIFLRDLKWSH